MRKVDERIDAGAEDASGRETVLTEDKDVLYALADITCRSPTPVQHFIKNNTEGPRPLISLSFYPNSSRAKDAHIIFLKGYFIASFSFCPFRQTLPALRGISKTSPIFTYKLKFEKNLIFLQKTLFHIV